MELTSEQLDEAVSRMKDLYPHLRNGEQILAHDQAQREIIDYYTGQATKLTAALADVQKERDEWHEMANKHLDTMVELQAELNGAQACVEEAHRTLSARVEEQAALKQQLADVTKERIRYELECKDLRRQLNNATEVLVENADLRKRLADVTKERDEYAERLEITHVYNSDGEREEIPREAWSQIPDGITCRDETIKLQDREIDKLAQQLTSAQATIQRLEEEHEEYVFHALGLAEQRGKEREALQQRLATVEGALRDLCDAIPQETLDADPPLKGWWQRAEQALAPAPGGHRKETRNDE